MKDPDDPAPGDRGPLESLFQEVVRRALSLGLGGFFLTEEAVRRALSESVPQEWVEYLARQSDEVRGELTDRLVREFGIWLRSLDLAEVVRTVLDEYEFSAQLDLKANAKEGSRTPLGIVRRKRG